ncbi:MAG: hypothetical protein ACLFNK_03240 [Candidatus Woesearchaeota archaeon]
MQIIIHKANKISDLSKIPEKFGVEIDVRSYGQELILNHEPYLPGDRLDAYLAACSNRMIIFNIKEDGIEDDVIRMAERYGLSEYFLLDVEFPYIYKATRHTAERRIAARFSEAEPIESVKSLMREDKPMVDWVWIDTNTRLPITSDNKEILERFNTCLVCPERWGRPGDIPKYKRRIKEMGFRLDAVMTSLEHSSEWSELD